MYFEFEVRSYMTFFSPYHAIKTKGEGGGAGVLGLSLNEAHHV